jgi:hypothetical protein
VAEEGEMERDGIRGRVKRGPEEGIMRDGT